MTIPMPGWAARLSVAVVFSILLAGCMTTGNTKAVPDRGGVAVVRDPFCTTQVEPFELTSNFTELAGIMATGAAQQLVSFGGAPDPLALAKTAAKNMNWMPIDLEIAIGEIQHEDEKEVIDREERASRRYYQTADALLKAVLARLPRELPYDFKLFVTREEVEGARARPGGFLYISRNALPTQDDSVAQQRRKRAMALFMLSHEVSHVLKRHETKQTQAQLIDSATTFGQMTDIMKSNRADPGRAVALAQMLSKRFTHYSIDQEKQADACGLRLILEAGAGDPVEAFSHYIEWYQKQSKAEADNFADAHPDYADRLSNGKAVIAHWKAQGQSQVRSQGQGRGPGEARGQGRRNG